MRFNQLTGEHELLREIACGSQPAFAKLFNGYFNQMGEFINTLTGSEELTEEIIIDVFTKIWVKRESLESINKFNAYLFILVRNHTLNCIRKSAIQRKKQQVYNQSVDLLCEPDFTEAIDDNQRYELVDRAVLLLPTQQQKVFMLRQQGFKNPEIAQLLNISTESVTKYQQLAVKFVSEFIKGQVVVSAIIWSATHLSK